MAATSDSPTAALVFDNSVAEDSARVAELKAKRLLPRTLLGGTTAMRAAETTFLPQHKNEHKDVYTARLASTFLYNGFQETVKAQASKMYQKPIVLGKDIPPEIATLCDDIDGQGSALTPYMLDVTENGFTDGIAYIFVDMPKVNVGATLEDQRAAGIRPYWSLIKANDVKGWRYATINGKTVLTQLRIYECTSEADGEFGERHVERVRVLFRGGFRLYEKQRDEKGNVKWVLIDKGTTSWSDITVVPVYVNRTGFFEGSPPLTSLAEMNCEHWQSSSEQRYALSFGRFAMLALMGVKETKDVTVGPSKVIGLPSGGDAKYIEPTGAAITSGKEDIEAIEKRMQGAGMELRVENAGSVTATAASIDSNESNAGLKAVAKGIESAINQALAFTAMMLQIKTGGGHVEVYDEFAEPPPEGDTSVLQSMRNTRDLSRATFWKEMQRRHVLDDDFDADDEAKLLDAEGPTELQGQPLPLPTKGGAKPVQQSTPAKGDA